MGGQVLAYWNHLAASINVRIHRPTYLLFVWCYVWNR